LLSNALGFSYFVQIFLFTEYSLPSVCNATKHNLSLSWTCQFLSWLVHAWPSQIGPKKNHPTSSWAMYESTTVSTVLCN
jgi:hypothetical protein